MIWELLFQLKVWCTLFHAHSLGLVATRHYASVVVRQHDHRNAFQVRSEDTFTAHVAIIEVSYSVHSSVVFKSPDEVYHHAPNFKIISGFHFEHRIVGVGWLQFYVAVSLMGQIQVLHGELPVQEGYDD